MRALPLMLCLPALLLVACQRPPAPNPERPPQPQALARAANAPLERAKGVQQTVDDAARRERAAEAEAEVDAP